MKSIIDWLFDLVSNFRVHIVILSIIGMMLVAIIFKTLLAALIFFIPLFYALLPLHSWRLSKNILHSNNNNAFEICSFNIEWNATEHTQSLNFIKDSQADIVVLQEVPQSLTSTIAEYKTIFPSQLGEGHSHVMVLSKHPLQLVEYLPWPGKFQERALHVICNVNGMSLHIFAIHVQVTRSWKQISLRDQQINTLVEKLNEIDQPVLVIGDFNAATGSNLLRDIERRTQMRNSESLLNYNSTWPAKAGVLGIQLDHIFSNEQIKLSMPELGPTLDSDHRPISVKFSFS